MTPKMAFFDVLPLIMQGYKARLVEWEEDRYIFLGESGLIEMESHNGNMGTWNAHPSNLVAYTWVAE